MSIIPQSPIVRERLFTVSKYLVYGLLAWNGYMFYLDESVASTITFSGGLSLSEIIEVHSGSIDTTFWIFLVILLELETYVIDDEILKRTAVKWTMIGLRTVCYAMIVYALYGYIVKTAFQSDMVPFAVANVCDVVKQNFSILLAVEDYVPLTAENCQALAGEDLYRLNGYSIIAPLDDLIYARNVARIDIVNASVWLGVVAILEVDVWYQLKGGLKGTLLRVSNILKGIFYTILFGCAVAWGYTGVLLDFGDAFVWLFAFFFIEMNLFQWQKETEKAVATA
ncbi:MAG: hypothetical protein IH996_05380 [Proteobacteria bacterium]|nr:hypothetical protein [Pseudomonadota bacterium]